MARTFPDKIKSLERDIAAIADPNDAYRVTLQKDLGLAKFFLDDAVKFKIENAAPPGLTYEGQVKVWIGGEEVRIFHVAPGHTDGDSMVYFAGQKVLHIDEVVAH